jgi:hypothetical protein
MEIKIVDSAHRPGATDVIIGDASHATVLTMNEATLRDLANQLAARYGLKITADTTDPW